MNHLFQVSNIVVSSGFKGGERAKVNRKFSLFGLKKIKDKESCYFCPCSISLVLQTYIEYPL